MQFSKILLIWISFLTHTSTVNCENKEILFREKRSLLYGPTTNIQMIIGYATPIADYLSPSLSLGFFLKGVYALPKNASDYLRPNITTLTRSFSSVLSRWNLYKALEKDSESKGYGGRNCILRTICEAADIPLDKYHGFFEELFHVIFTPSTTNEKIQEHSDNEYLAAQQLGKKYKNKCKLLFPNCKFSFFDLYTQLFSQFDND